MEKSLLLKCLIKLLIRLSKSDVKHGDEGLLNSRGSVMKCRSEISTGQGGEDGREESRIQLADVRYGHCG